MPPPGGGGPASARSSAFSLRIAAREYLNQIVGGIPMNQAEFARPLRAWGSTRSDLGSCPAGACQALDASQHAGRAGPSRRADDRRQGAATFGDCGLDDTLDEMRAEMRRFVDGKVAPHAHAWHLANAYVPLELIEELAGLGVFALTLPEHGAAWGSARSAMCVVSEELSRGWIAVGSLGTRAEIACELILQAAPRSRSSSWLPGIATGEILPTAVFTEPDTGSDLGSPARPARSSDGDRLSRSPATRPGSPIRSAPTS